MGAFHRTPRRLFCLAAVLTALAVGAPAGWADEPPSTEAAAAVPGRLLWQDPFADEPVMPRGWDEPGPGDPPALYGLEDAVGDYSFPEAGVLRVVTRKAEDPGSSHHTMFSVGWGAEAGAVGWVLAFDRAKTYRFTFETLVERQAPDPKWNIVFQNKTWPDPGEVANNPTFALMTREGAWALDQRGDGKAAVPDKDYMRSASAALGPVAYDSWTAWQIDIRFDWEPAGLVRVWRDGTEVWSAVGVRTTYRDEAPGGANLSFGQYEYYAADSPDWNAVRFRNIAIYELAE